MKNGPENLWDMPTPSWGLYIYRTSFLGFQIKEGGVVNSAGVWD
jgi:hypothetical protein